MMRGGLLCLFVVLLCFVVFRITPLKRNYVLSARGQIANDTNV